MEIDFFFSFVWHKILVLIFNMFIYVKVGHSKFVEMHGNASDFYWSTLVFYTWHRVNISIYLSNCIHTDMCKRKKKIYTFHTPAGDKKRSCAKSLTQINKWTQLRVSFIKQSLPLRTEDLLLLIMILMITFLNILCYKFVFSVHRVSMYPLALILFFEINV